MRGVLVLNASYEAINVCSVNRALKLMFSGGAAVEQASAVRVVRAARAAFPEPSVIRLLHYRRIPRQTRSLSRKAILIRDSHTCQYCLQALDTRQLTLDHIQPRSRGGATSWENLVACCHRCNNRKGARTPEEAGMNLARQPKPFGIHTSRNLMRIQGDSDQAWRKYLFY
jgi:5-methylcytosine-specific restriction endonuclease McrA